MARGSPPKVHHSRSGGGCLYGHLGGQVRLASSAEGQEEWRPMRIAIDFDGGRGTRRVVTAGAEYSLTLKGAEEREEW